MKRRIKRKGLSRWEETPYKDCPLYRSNRIENSTKVTFDSKSFKSEGRRITRNTFIPCWVLINYLRGMQEKLISILDFTLLYIKMA